MSSRKITADATGHMNKNPENCDQALERYYKAERIARRRAREENELRREKEMRRQIIVQLCRATKSPSGASDRPAGRAQRQQKAVPDDCRRQTNKPSNSGSVLTTPHRVQRRTSNINNSKIILE